MTTTDNSELLRKLEADGLSDSLRAQLRAQVLRKVKGQTAPRSPTAMGEIVASLFSDYLRACNFEFTLAVFLPESGSSGKSLSAAELRDRLHLPPSTGPVLDDLFKAYHTLLYRSHTLDAGVQTQDPSIDLQLQFIENQHKLRLVKQPKSLQEEIIAIERECRERYQTALAKEIAHIRTVEAAAVRAEESRKYQESINRLQSEFETRWRQKLDEIHAREKENERLLDAKQREFDAAVTVHKLQVEKDLATLQRKEGEIADNIGATLIQLKTQQETYERLNSELDAKTREMETLKISFERRCADDMQRLQRDFEEANYLQKQQILVEREETDRLRQSTEFEISSKRESEIRVVMLMKEVENVRKTLQSTMEELSLWKEDARELREQLAIVAERAKRSGDLLTLKELTIESLRSEVQSHKDTIDRQKDTIRRLQQDLSSEPISLPETSSTARGDIQSRSELSLTLESWRIERESHWRELDAMEAEIKRKYRDQETVPTQRYKDAYSGIVIPKKAFVQVETHVQPRTTTLDSAEARQNTVNVETAGSRWKPQQTLKSQRSEHKRSMPAILVEERKQEIPTPKKSDERKPTEERKKEEKTPLKVEDLKTSPKASIAVKKEEDTVVPPAVPQAPVNDSIIEEIVIDPSSASNKASDESLHGFDSESLEAPPRQSSEEEDFF